MLGITSSKLMNLMSRCGPWWNKYLMFPNQLLWYVLVSTLFFQVSEQWSLHAQVRTSMFPKHSCSSVFCSFWLHLSYFWDGYGLFTGATLYINSHRWKLGCCLLLKTKEDIKEGLEAEAAELMLVVTRYRCMEILTHSQTLIRGVLKVLNLEIDERTD